MQTAVLTDADAFENLRADWEELLEDSDQMVFFLSWSWNWEWWRCLAPQNSNLFVVTFRDSLGRLVGLAPMYRRRRGFLRELYFLGTGVEIRTSEYLNLIARRGYEERVGSALATFLSQRRGWDRLCLWGFPAGTPVIASLVDAFHGRPRVTHCDQTYHVVTDTDWETFRKSLGASTRKNVEYQYRRLFRLRRSEFRRVETQEELPAALDDLMRLHQLRWEGQGQPGAFAFPRFANFIRGSAVAGLRARQLKMWTLAVDGKIVSVQLGFAACGIVHLLLNGYDPTLAEYRIGNVMTLLCIKDCIQTVNVRVCDFMGGDEAYKKHWAKEGQSLSTLELLQPGWRTALYATGRCARRRLIEVWNSGVWKRVRKERV